jgi:hypothetical protein
MSNSESSLTHMKVWESIRWSTTESRATFKTSRNEKRTGSCPNLLPLLKVLHLFLKLLSPTFLSLDYGDDEFIVDETSTDAEQDGNFPESRGASIGGRAERPCLLTAPKEFTDILR